MRRDSCLALCLLILIPLWGCGDPNVPPVNSQAGQSSPPAFVRPAKTEQKQQNQQTQNLQDGQYPIQQASFDDAAGEYTLMVLNTPAGMSSTLELSELPMARLTDEQLKAGEKSYLKVEGGKPSMYLTEDFKIAYQHNVTEQQTNPQTGNRETVVVRKEGSFWSPFLGSVAGSVAGQAIGGMLFRPQHYVPPIYQPGMGGLTGFGGYGNTYGGAVDNYRSRYNEPPVAERNRTTFRSTGALRDRTGTSGSSGFGSQQRLPSGQGGAFKPSVSDLDKQKSTGSGFGSSNLRKTGKTYQSPSIGTPRRSSSSGFGSSRGGGGGRRR
jgi:hypothetical protein